MKEEQLISAAHQLIEQAKAVQETHPQEARKMFLSASEYYLQASKVSSVHQKRYVQQASKWFTEAKILGVGKI